MGFKTPMKIYHVAKKRNLHLFDLQDMVRFQNLKERRLGSLPSDWLTNIKPDEYCKVTQKVDNLFSTFAEKSYDTELETLDGISAELVKGLKKLLRRDDISMDYVDNGYFKECSKLTVGDYAYAFLTFFEKFGMHQGDARTFGKYFEPQSIFFTYKKMPHGRMAKPFMSRFSTDYFEHGYMLNKYIDKNDAARAKTQLNPLRNEYYEYSIPDSSERSENMINNVIIDAGGIVKNTNYIKDKTFRRNLFVFLDRIYINCPQPLAKSDLKLTIMKKANVDDYLCKQLDSGTDIYSADLRELLKPFDEQEKIYAKRQIRQLRNVHKLKKELKANGTFEKYKPYLKKASNTNHISPLLARELEILN